MTSPPACEPSLNQRPTRVLFVCLGNICRSPAAEAVFLDLLEQQGRSHHFEVDSAGTGGWHVGCLADARMRNAAGHDSPRAANEPACRNARRDRP